MEKKNEIEKPKLWEHASEFMELCREIEENGETPELIERIDKFSVQLKEKMDGVLYVLHETYPSKIAEVDGYIKACQARKQSLTNAQDRMKKYIGEQLDRMKMEKYKGTVNTIYKRKSKSVELTVPDQDLPEEYREQRISYKADKKKIKDALEKGEDVPGARIAENFSWTIR